MFDWVGSQVTTILDAQVVQVVTKLSGLLLPVALASVTIWIILYGWAFLRNAAFDNGPEFVWKMMKVTSITLLALHAGLYLQVVADTANALSLDIAKAVLPPSIDVRSINTPYQLLDSLNEDASKVVLDLWREADITRLELFAAAIICSIGNVFFLVTALFTVTLSKVLLTFALALGPLFILCLLWKPTQRFFDSWLSFLLQAVVMSWFVFFALGISSTIGSGIFSAISQSGGMGGPELNVIAETLKYVIVMILMGLLCMQAPLLAASLTGGPVVQQGLQMVQNLSRGQGFRTNRDVAASQAGGTIRAGTGPAYQAGHAFGKAASSTAKAASNVSPTLQTTLRALYRR